LSPHVQQQVREFLSDPDRGRPREEELISAESDERAITEHNAEKSVAKEESITNAQVTPESRMVDVVLSDMSAPWDQTTGFSKRSLSDPYHRMMNTSGNAFRDHAGSMVRSSHDI
jgi:21S rRNA (uridine2791-2'-O)-methyltransferase